MCQVKLSSLTMISIGPIGSPVLLPSCLTGSKSSDLFVRDVIDRDLLNHPSSKKKQKQKVFVEMTI